jgi:hypothetical protein
MVRFSIAPLSPGKKERDSLSDQSVAVAFLESMGLPQPMLSTTRKQVEKGKLDFRTSLEWNMYSRHDKPTYEDEDNGKAPSV